MPICPQAHPQACAEGAGEWAVQANRTHQTQTADCFDMLAKFYQRAVTWNHEKQIDKLAKLKHGV